MAIVERKSAWGRGELMWDFSISKGIKGAPSKGIKGAPLWQELAAVWRGEPQIA